MAEEWGSLMRDKLCELVCESIQTDECIAHCRNYCGVCIKVVDRLIASGMTTSPWRVGDIIYYINLQTNTVETDTVIRLTVTKAGVNPILKMHNTSFWKHYTWFTSQEEAENYLAEQQRAYKET